MGRKKKEKKKKKAPAVKNTVAVIKNTTVGSAQPDQLDLRHLSDDWREFYRQVIDQVR
mgnify:CR=1 FL=1